MKLEERIQHEIQWLTWILPSGLHQGVSIPLSLLTPSQCPGAAPEIQGSQCLGGAVIREGESR